MLFSALQGFFPRLAFREWCWASPAGNASRPSGPDFSNDFQQTAAILLFDAELP